MSRFGTDLVALGCILGGAAAGSVATLALAHVDSPGDLACGAETVWVSPKVAISGGGDAGTILVTPDVRVRANRDCVSHWDNVVRIRLDNHAEDLDLHLGHLDGQLEHLDRMLEAELQKVESQLEAEFGQQMEARAQFEEAMRQVEEAKIKVVVKRTEGGGI